MTTITNILDDSVALPAAEADRVRFYTARPSLDRLDAIGPAWEWREQSNPARGIVWASLLGALLWAMFGAALYAALRWR